VIRTSFRSKKNESCQSNHSFLTDKSKFPTKKIELVEARISLFHLSIFVPCKILVDLIKAFDIYFIAIDFDRAARLSTQKQVLILNQQIGSIIKSIFEKF